MTWIFHHWLVYLASYFSLKAFFLPIAWLLGWASSPISRLKWEWEHECQLWQSARARGTSKHFVLYVIWMKYDCFIYGLNVYYYLGIFVRVFVKIFRKQANKQKHTHKQNGLVEAILLRSPTIVFTSLRIITALILLPVHALNN